jgi:hypothetical protein
LVAETQFNKLAAGWTLTEARVAAAERETQEPCRWSSPVTLRTGMESSLFP